MRANFYSPAILAAFIFPSLRLLPKILRMMRPAAWCAWGQLRMKILNCW
jgi:hypothetical protein